MTPEQALETWESLIKPRLNKRPPNGKTLMELSKEMGMNRRTIGGRVKELLETGKLEQHLVAGLRAPVYTIKSVQERPNASTGRRKRRY